eukprot:2900186-Pyramimonas_sp.AAC.1
MIGRAWSKAREPWVQQWTSDTEPSWDAAARGNSPLQEAFRRLLDEETAAVLGTPYAHSLVDLEQY